MNACSSREMLSSPKLRLIFWLASRPTEFMPTYTGRNPPRPGPLTTTTQPATGSVCVFSLRMYWVLADVSIFGVAPWPMLAGLALVWACPDPPLRRGGGVPVAGGGGG